MTRHNEHTKAQRHELRGWQRHLGSALLSESAVLSCAYPMATIVVFPRTEGPT